MNEVTVLSCTADVTSDWTR